MGSQELQEEPGLANKIGSEYDDPTADGLHLASDILSRVLQYPLHPPVNHDNLARDVSRNNSGREHYDLLCNVRRHRDFLQGSARHRKTLGL